MRKLAIAVALASTALATPAVARDHSLYVGLEGGAMWVEDSPFNVTDNLTNPHFTLDHKTGYDVDAIAGYDFGAVRLEAELGYKHAAIDSINSITTVFAASGKATALSLMGNVLFDFGDDNGFSGYAGAGIGIARAKYSFTSPNIAPYIGVVDFSDSDSRLAYQGILCRRLRDFAEPRPWPQISFLQTSQCWFERYFPDQFGCDDWCRDPEGSFSVRTACSRA